MHIKISYSGQVVKKLSESFPNNTQSWITLPQDNESMRSHQTFYFWMSYSWKGLAQKKYPNNSIPLARLQHVSIPRTSVATPIYIKSDMTGFRYLWFFVAFLCGVINESLPPFYVWCLYVVSCSSMVIASAFTVSTQSVCDVGSWHHRHECNNRCIHVELASFEGNQWRFSHHLSSDRNEKDSWWISHLTPLLCLMSDQLASSPLQLLRS